MVMYSQVQDALLLTFPLNDAEVEQRIARGFTDFTEKIKPWNIKVPLAIAADFREHGESFI